MSIPSIIKQQLFYANTSLVWSWGAHKWTAISDTTLAFRVNAHRLDGIVCIELDEGADLYNISFFKNKRFRTLLEKPLTQFESIQGVYCDELVYMIDDVIEKIDIYQF